MQTLNQRLLRALNVPHDSPRFTNSQMDGYAVPACEGCTWQCGPTITAGATAEALYSRGLGKLAAPS